MPNWRNSARRCKPRNPFDRRPGNSFDLRIGPFVESVIEPVGRRAFAGGHRFFMGLAVWGRHSVIERDRRHGVCWRKTSRSRADAAGGRFIAVPWFHQASDGSISVEFHSHSCSDVSSAPAISRWSEGVSAEMPLLEALESVFCQRWTVVLHLLPRATVYDPNDCEPVHKLRVAARRLSAVLDVLAEAFPEAPKKRLFRTVDEIRRVCGAARDVDVRRQFLETLVPSASHEDAGIIEVLCERMIRKREAMQRRLGKRLLRLERKLRRCGEELVEALDLMRDPDPPSAGNFAETGARVLLKELEVVWSRAALDCESMKGLHRLRIACKRLRYAAEIFFPVLDPRLRETFYPHLEQIQELLGEVHDATVASDKLRRQHKKWRRRRREHEWTGGGLAAFNGRELRVAVDGIQKAYADAGVRAEKAFHELWPDFSGEGFRLPVTRLLTEPDEVSRRPGLAEGSTGQAAAVHHEPGGSWHEEGSPDRTTCSEPQNGAPRAVLPAGGE